VNALVRERAAWRPLGATLLLAAAVVAVFLAPGVSEALAYDRDSIRAGQVWRIVTGHWTHWTLEHLTWDLIVFTILFAWSLRISWRRTAAVVLGSCAAIPAGLWFLQPEMASYRGLSGVDSALFVFVALEFARSCRQRRDATGVALGMICLAGLGAKASFEWATGQTVFVSHLGERVAPVPLAHLIGGVVGAMVHVLGNARPARRREPPEAATFRRPRTGAEAVCDIQSPVNPAHRR